MAPNDSVTEPTQPAPSDATYRPDEADLFLDDAGDVWRCNHLGRLDLVGILIDAEFLHQPFADVVKSYGPLHLLKIVRTFDGS